MPTTSSLRILAVDPGTKRWGVAVGETATGLAKPLTPVIAPFDQAILAIVNLFRTERADAMLLGHPVHMDDTTHSMTKVAEKACTVFRKHGLKVKLYDERLSSFAAEQQLFASGKSTRQVKKQVDSTAAALMLEAAFREGIFRAAE